MKIQPARVAAFVGRPDPAVRGILVYGPDQGMVRERASALARTVVEDLSDPFRVSGLSGSDLAGDPALLADEAAAMALTGGRRVVQVRDAGDALAKLFEEFLADPPGDALVVVEAGDLAARSKLRKAFETAKKGAALACYPDEAGALAEIVSQTLAKFEVTADSEAMEYLSGALGGDRGVTRSELEKLAIYAGTGATVTVEDAIAMVGDSARLSLDNLSIAVGSGDAARADALLQRLFQEGAQPVGVLRSVARHFMRLHAASASMQAGKTTQQAMADLRPPVFFKQAEPFRAQLERWGGGRGLTRLETVLRGFAEAEARCKSTGFPAEAVCGRAMIAATAMARAGRS